MRQLRFLLKWVNLLLITVFVGISALMPETPAFAQASTPTLIDVQPKKAANDVDTPIKISGSGFSNEGGTPQVFLGDIPLEEIGWVNTTTLTAQVPWGMNAGVYYLKVVNPDGGEDTLASPFEVTQGVGQWNSNAMDGGPVQTVIPISTTAGLLYAYSNITSAVYRSTDYGANWTTVGHTGGQFFTYDPIHPNYMYNNNMQSSDGGATWRNLLEDGLWPGTGKYPGSYTQVFPDPAHSGTIFLATANIPSTNSEASGLLRSTDYGQNWVTVENGLLSGDNNVTAMEFYGSTIYLGTRDGNLYQSTNGGSSWSRIGSTNVLPSIGVLKVNPYKPAELWITTHFSLTATAQVVKMNLTDHSVTSTSWSVENYPKTLGFLDENTVFIASNWDNGWITENGGTNWNLFQPSTGKPGYCLSLDPWDISHNTFYIADEQYGVQKTTNRGVTWTPINQGLHAMSPSYLAVDPTNPSLVYAKISENGWPGIFVSDNGGQNWNFSSLVSAMGGVRPMTSMLAVSGDRVFAGAHGSKAVGYGPQLFISQNHGDSWKLVKIDPTPAPAVSSSFHMPWILKADPDNPETLLLTAIIGDRSMTTDQYVSEIYRSEDYGDTWQRINLKSQLGHDVNNLGYLAFDPRNPNIVYAAGDHEILKSVDNGRTWTAIFQDNTTQVGGPIAVEPVAPYRVYVGNQVSVDGGSTWNSANLPIGVSQMIFVPGTDTLYIAGNGLAVSNNGGTSWNFPQGALASAQITGLAVSRSDRRTVIYVGTPGGSTFGAAARTAGASMEAGIYRMTEVRTYMFMPLIKR